MTTPTLTIPNLNTGTYKITIYDLGAPGCEYSENFAIEIPSSTLIIDNISVTY